ncbi:MAG TPA: DegT/DnrJ/EryC1/StrS family aminotransferase [Anaerolineales bacterium]|nr:DegT/DnrJ/EryC1/StrS family aminotransferase [Anaerolineales bacterium]
MRIPMSSPDLTDLERDAVLAVLRTPRLSMGPQIEAFEAAVARQVGARHAVAVSSGTAGLHIAVRLAGVQDGDLVLTTPFSFVASANVMLYERAVPLFVDVDGQTGNLDVSQAVQAIKELTHGAGSRWLPRRGAAAGAKLRGLLPVDAFGQPADFDPLTEAAKRAGLPVIEDSCEAFGATYKGRPAGRLGDVGVYAFYPNKQMTTAEGGLIVTDRDDWADLARALRNQGRAPGDTWLEHTYLGYNYRLDELSAALGAAQMQRWDELLAKRDRVAEWYGERLAEMRRVQAPSLAPTTTRMSWFVYVVRLDADADRRRVMERLETQGIPSRPYFAPIHLMRYFVDQFGYQPGDFPVTEDLGRRSLALPFSGVMTEDQVDEVCRGLREAIG